ncbi:hypothetical protein DFH09DRAFT_1364429 [Mycena vulgaris]|nr:hypothetical protein DFH09DRAFT_1364429 [Mycena vulgaris]
MLHAKYSQDLINCIVDYSAGDLQALARLSLVDKCFLSRARQIVFGNLTVHVCCDPSLHREGRRRCGTSHCLIMLAPLLRSSHCFIPRTVGRLVLSGRDVANVVTHYYFWTLVPHTGGMDDVGVVLPFLKHFRDINRLELIDIDWFTFSSRSSSRALTSFFSSVKHLVIDDARFYSGPQALLSNLAQVSHLESLTILDTSWPSTCGMRELDGAPGIIVFIIQTRCIVSPAVGFILSPIFYSWLGWRKLKGLLPRRRHRLRKPLQHLTLNFDMMDAPLHKWLLAQKPMLAQLSSAALCPVSPTHKDDSSDMQSFLDILPPVPHLVIRWPSGERAVPAVPSLALHHTLRVLEVQLRAVSGVTWDACTAWLRETLGTLTSEHLTTLVLNICSADLLRASSPAPDLEDPVLGQHAPGMRWVQTLEKVDVRIALAESVSGRHGSVRESFKRIVPLLFPVCHRRGLLTVRVKADTGVVSDALNRVSRRR